MITPLSFFLLTLHLTPHSSCKYNRTVSSFFPAGIFFIITESVVDRGLMVGGLTAAGEVLVRGTGGGWRPSLPIYKDK